MIDAHSLDLVNVIELLITHTCTRHKASNAKEYIHNNVFSAFDFKIIAFSIQLNSFIYCTFVVFLTTLFPFRSLFLSLSFARSILLSHHGMQCIKNHYACIGPPLPPSPMIIIIAYTR